MYVRVCVCVLHIGQWKRKPQIYYIWPQWIFFFGLVFLCEKKLSIFVSGYPRTKQKNLIRLNKSKLPPFFFWILNRPSPISFDFRCLYLYSLPFFSSHCHCFFVFLLFKFYFIFFWSNEVIYGSWKLFGHTHKHTDTGPRFNNGSTNLLLLSFGFFGLVKWSMFFFMTDIFFAVLVTLF